MLERVWRKGNPLLVFLPGEFHGKRSLASYTHGITELDRTEQLTHTHTHTHTHTQRIIIKTKKNNNKRKHILSLPILTFPREK